MKFSNMIKSPIIFTQVVTSTSIRHIAMLNVQQNVKIDIVMLILDLVYTDAQIQIYCLQVARVSTVISVRYTNFQSCFKNNICLIGFAKSFYSNQKFLFCKNKKAKKKIYS